MIRITSKDESKNAIVSEQRPFNSLEMSLPFVVENKVHFFEQIS